MPKEITHWLIARRTTQGLNRTAWAEPVEAQPHLLRLAAVFPDVPFYLGGPGDPAGLRGLGARLHGAGGEDTFAPVRRLLEGRSRPSGLAAWLVGLLSHVSADAVFHPLVGYQAGDLRQPDPGRRSLAVQRHRRLEAAIDLHLAGGLARVRTCSLRASLRRAEAPLGRLGGASIPGVGLGPEEKARWIVRGFRRFALVQGLTRNSVLAAWLHRIRAGLPRPAREAAALVYAPQLARSLAGLNGPIAYRHPVTGQAFSRSLAELVELAAAETVALCRLIEPAVFAGERLELPRGPCLDTGLVGPAGRMRYFASRPLIGV